MDAAATHPMPRGRPLWVKVLAGIVVVVALLALLIVFFPWDVLRGPLNRYVTEKTGRHFEITRRLDVKLGRTTRILADGLEFANPEWARDPMLVKAAGAEVHIELLPLLGRRIVMPLIRFHEPQLGLQIEPDGRRSWALGRDTGDPANLPEIGALAIDKGSVHFVASEHGADIRTDFAIAGPLRLAPNAAAPQAQAQPGGAPQAALPLAFTAKGTWQKEPFTARGRTGNVLYLREALRQPFPAEFEATAANTTLRAKGSIASLATLEGANASFTIQGKDLQELYQLVGMVLPATPRYSLQGRLSKQDEVWHIREIDGRLGNSDLRGELAFDRRVAVPLLTGKLESRTLDFVDLAPLVGLQEQPRSAQGVPQVRGRRPAPVRTAAGGKVLPSAELDVDRLRRMNADVTYRAARITHVKKLPLDRMSVHVRLKDGVLDLDQMKLGVAGGSLAGRVRIDGVKDPAVAEVRLDARSLQLARLFPNARLTKASVGAIHGDIDLKGRGNTVAKMLATSDGAVALLMGSGQISNLLMEIAGIDGAEIIKFFMQGDENVQLRCAAAAFDVKDGLMTSRAVVFDTSDTVIYGSGAISLATEAMDLTLRPYPKDMSILSLRSPLKVGGTFAKPQAGPDKGALAARGGFALALGAFNPLLALAATIETGPGENANCGPALREASSAYQAARIAVMNQPPEIGDDAKKKGLLSRILGGPNDKEPAPRGGRERTPQAGGPHAPGGPGKPYGP
ncbi:MAG: AsmA family protein [Ramlibacter sp.]